MWRKLTIGILAAVSSLFPLAAQQHTGLGTITGIITDSQNATVPGAMVSALETKTGIKTFATTNQSGVYTIPFLPVGTYSLSVDAAGFRTYTQTGITISTSSSPKVDIRLEVGASTEKVVVHAQAPLLETQSAELGTTISGESYSNLPLAVSSGRRDGSAFMFLVPGVTGGSFYNQIDGGADFTKEIWIDGAPTASMELGGDTRTVYGIMSVDAINEFKVDTNNLGADLGHGSGVLSYTTKSGTNTLHGTMYDFLRNTFTDARAFFSPNVPRDIQNEFGANIGGPVFIPKLYDGHDRTFFFFDYNGYRHHLGAPPALTTVPTQQMVAGNFSASGIAPIYDPLTTCGEYGNPPCAVDGSGNPIITRQQFPGNVIPSNRFSSVSKNFLPYVPAPDYPGLLNNFQDQYPGGKPIFSSTSYDVRLDHKLSDRQSITGSWMFGHDFNSGSTYNGLPAPFAAYTPTIDSGTTIRLSDTFALRSDLINRFTFGYNRLPNAYHDPNKGTDWPAKLGLTGVSLLEVTMPEVNFATDGFAAWAPGTNTGFNDVPYSYVYEEELLWLKGRHSISLGADIRLLGENYEQDSNSGGFTFSDLETGQPGIPSTGNSFASFLLGDVDTGTLSLNAAGTTGDRIRNMAYYAEDGIKVTPKLNVNIGLRWEVPYGDTEVNDKQSSLDPNLPNPGAGNILGALSFVGYGTGKCNCVRFYPVDYTEFAPQFGAAYQIDSKTVIRGGYGIFYTAGGQYGGVAERGLVTGWSTSPAYYSPNGGVNAAFDWDSGFPQTFTPPPQLTADFANGTNINWYDRKLNKAPYYGNWNVNLQRQVAGNILLSVAYVGSKGTRLPTGLFNPDQTSSKYLALGNLLGADINSPQAQAAIAAGTIPGPPYSGFTGTVSQSLRPYPQYSGITVENPFQGSSTYNALQVEAKTTSAHGLTFLVSYTGSKTLTDADSLIAWLNGALGRDTNNRKIEKSLSLNDIPRTLSVSYVYELPFGPNKKFLSGKGVIGKAVEGWQVSGIDTYYKGTPLGISVNDTLNIFNQTNDPNRVSGVSPRSSAPINATTVNTDASYFNSAAFVDPAPFTFGNGSRTYGNLREPAYYNEDFSLTKRTYFTEHANVEFRWEIYDMFNRTVFSVGGQNFDDPTTFGRVYSQANLPRQMQFGLRVNY